MVMGGKKENDDPRRLPNPKQLFETGGKKIKCSLLWFVTRVKKKKRQDNGSFPRVSGRSAVLPTP